MATRIVDDGAVALNPSGIKIADFFMS